MKLTKTEIDGVLIMEPEAYEDSRGFFWRSFDHDELAKAGVIFDIKQTNSTLTLRQGSVRGMHFQIPPMGEGKIVQCLRGRIYDVVFDMRNTSVTYGKWFGVELSDKNRQILFMPEGFAHGFQALTDNCLVHYYMSERYSPEHASGVRWDDPLFNLKWPQPVTEISEKDNKWPLL